MMELFFSIAGNGWEVASPQTVRVGRNGASISCIAAAAGRIWCGCQNNVILVNASTLKIEVNIKANSSQPDFLSWRNFRQ